MGEAGEIWDPPARFPRQHTACRIWVSRGQAQSWRPAPKRGLPLAGTGTARTLWHPLFRNCSFFPLSYSMFLGLLHKHSVARQPSSLLSSWIPGNSVQANSLECAYSWCCAQSQLSCLALGLPSRSPPASVLYV